MNGVGIASTFAAVWRTDPDVLRFALLAVVLSLGFVWLIRSSLRLLEPTKNFAPHDSTAADGLVPLVELNGVDAAPIEERPKIRRFLRRGDLESGVDRPRSGALLGRVAVFSIFVGRDGVGWDDREIVEAFDAVERMGRWIEGQATRFNVPVNLERVDVAFVAVDPEIDGVEITSSLDPFQGGLAERDGDAKAIASASRAAAALGFADLLALIAWAEDKVDHDATIWLVHMLREGRSCVARLDRGNADRGGIAICYARHAGLPAPLTGLPYVDPATIAHEVMHLFGAVDKYGTPVRTFPAGAVTSRDIMRLDESRLSRLRIDPLTAVEIGWLPNPRRTAEKEKRPARRLRKNGGPGG